MGRKGAMAGRGREEQLGQYGKRGWGGCRFWRGWMKVGEA